MQLCPTPLRHRYVTRQERIEAAAANCAAVASKLRLLHESLSALLDSVDAGSCHVSDRLAHVCGTAPARGGWAAETRALKGNVQHVREEVEEARVVAGKLKALLPDLDAHICAAMDQPPPTPTPLSSRPHSPSSPMLPIAAGAI